MLAVANAIARRSMAYLAGSMAYLAGSMAYLAGPIVSIIPFVSTIRKKQKIAMEYVDFDS